MKYALTLTALLSLSLSANCQTITFSQLGDNGVTIAPAIGTIDIANGCAISGPDTIYGNTVGGYTPIRGITYHPDGNFYGAYEGIGWLMNVNLDNQSGELVYIGTLGYSAWMKAAHDGAVYANSGGGILKCSVEDNADVEWIGPMGVDGIAFIGHMALTIINGEVYIYAEESWFPANGCIVKGNMEDPLHSDIVLDLPEGMRARAMTTFNMDCDSSATYMATYNAAGTGYEIYLLDLKAPSMTLVKELYGSIIALADFANPTEHLRFDCYPSLDLDQAGQGLGFKAEKTCVINGTGVYPFTSASPFISTNTIVDSIWVGITGGTLDGTGESLGCDASSFAECTTSGSGIMLRNTGQVSNGELVEWLRQSVFYQNDAQPATEGTRELALVAYNKDYPSDTARLWLPVQPGIVVEAEINDATSGANGGILLSSVAGGSGGSYQFLWGNGHTGQDLVDVPSGVYTLTVTDGGGCTASYTFTVDGPSAAGPVPTNHFGAAIVPNPSGGSAKILLSNKPSGMLQWAVLDAVGRRVGSGLTEGRVIGLPSGLPQGTYTVCITDSTRTALLRWIVL